MQTNPSLSIAERRLLVGVLGFIFVLVGADLVTDSMEGARWSHLLVELGIAVGAGCAFILLLRSLLKKNHALEYSHSLIAQRDKEAERWKLESQKYVLGLSQAIDAQLLRWALSISEKEIALLLLKGLSLKEIAEIRKTSEKTVRAQATAVYAKAGLSGRSELAAFFLEDLLFPMK